MIYGAVLAGGIGSRMKMADMPKQFLELGNRPIVIHTIEKFIACSRFDKIYVAIHADWSVYLQDLLDKHKITDSRIKIVNGGHDRNETIMNVIKSIENEFTLSSEDVIVTHDAVRPFITARIIDDNIDGAIKYGMCDTVLSATDTIVVSNDKEFISDIPDRQFMYQGQTPQSFNISLLKELYESLSAEQKGILTDACKICTILGKNVRLVEGDVYNMKITTAGDYKIAQAILSTM